MLNVEVDQRPHANILINGVQVKGLMDSGASVSCLGKDAFETLHKCSQKWKEFEGSVRTASDQPLPIVGYADADVWFQGQMKRLRFYIIPSLSNQVYLGVDFWVAFNLLPKLEELIVVDAKEEVGFEKDVETENADMHIFSDEQKKELGRVVELFPSGEKEGLGKTSLIKHTINVGNAKPTKQRYYAVSPAVEQKMYSEVDRMIELGVVEKSRSAWNSPVTCVTKANGKTRLCLDARMVNAVTEKDAYPMPLIDSIFSRLNETRYISSIDLRDAFWQIELDEASRDKTAFTIPGRPLYQFTRMPFGLCNAAQTMCRLMDLTIPSELRDRVFVYIDDLLVVSADFETHIKRLEKVAKSLRRANLTINVAKSKFGMRSIRYLGHIVGNGEIKPDPARVQCIADCRPPKTIKQVRRFLGMAGWYQRYIPNYSAVAAPMTDLLKKTHSFTWTPEAQCSFDALKEALTTAPVLTHPDFSKPFYVQCDASINGVGAVLFQIINGEEHPIAYMSKKLNTAQRNYSVTELECLAAVLAVAKFRQYIEGMAFTIITDHASLKWLMSQKDLTGRLARWSLKLQIFDFKIEHRKGTANVVPDTLSRMEMVDELSNPVGTPIDITDAAFKSVEYEALKKSILERKNELPDVEVRDGLVYKRTEFRTGDETVDLATAWKLWVPDELRNKTIAECHEPPSAAHGGNDKTSELVRRFYFWPGMGKQIRDYVAACETCKTTKATNQILKPPMGKQFVAERPFQHLYADLLGPYPRTKAGHTTIFIVLDQLSKFVWLKPLKKATAKNIGEFLENDIFNFVGAPESILTDNGVQFISKEIKELLTHYGVRHVFTATHSPQANASERVNRSILAAIRAYIETDQTTWDRHIFSIASALRNANHSSTGKSPYYTIFGQHMVQHAGSYKLLRNIQSLPIGDVEVVPSAEFRDAVNKQIRNKIQRAHEVNAKKYDTRTRQTTFKIGQEVFVRSFRQSDFTKNFNAKLGRQWLPARIVRQKGSCMYEIEDRTGKLNKMAYHAKDIRV